MGDRKIAKICGLSHVTIWSMRPVKNEQNATNPPVERVEVNERVGNSPSIEDRRETVKKWFEEYPTLHHLSDREIAKRCGVDHKTVGKIRKELFPDPEPVQDVAPAVGCTGLQRIDTTATDKKAAWMKLTQAAVTPTFQSSCEHAQ